MWWWVQCSTMQFTAANVLFYYSVLHRVIQWILVQCRAVLYRWYYNLLQQLVYVRVQHDFCHLFIQHLYVAIYELRYYRVFFYEINCWNTAGDVKPYFFLSALTILLSVHHDWAMFIQSWGKGILEISQLQKWGEAITHAVVSVMTKRCAFR